MQPQLTLLKAESTPFPQTDPQLTLLAAGMAVLTARLDALRSQWRTRWEQINGYEEEAGVEAGAVRSLPSLTLEPVDDTARLARLHARLQHAGRIAQEGITNEETADDLCRALHSAIGDVELLLKAAAWRTEVMPRA